MCCHSELLGAQPEEGRGRSWFTAAVHVFFWQRQIALGNDRAGHAASALVMHVPLSSRTVWSFSWIWRLVLAREWQISILLTDEPFSYVYNFAHILIGFTNRLQKGNLHELRRSWHTFPFCYPVAIICSSKLAFHDCLTPIFQLFS